MLGNGRGIPCQASISVSFLIFARFKLTSSCIVHCLLLSNLRITWFGFILSLHFYIAETLSGEIHFSRIGAIWSYLVATCFYGPVVDLQAKYNPKL